ncbi:MAG: DUF1761 domain-containing protein [Prolixibacteraceae bacterium]|nr:DUF1761 domain-containing protein [Prolixibacteraceae bacterium]
MDFCETLSNINYLAVLVAALSAFIIGWIWYGPLFAKRWMKLNGFTEESLKEGAMSMPAIMIINFVAVIVSALGMAMFLGAESDMMFGISAGLMIAVFWIATSRLNDVLSEKKPFGLFLINVGYNLVTYAVMGAIIGAWH